MEVAPAYLEFAQLRARMFQRTKRTERRAQAQPVMRVEIRQSEDHVSRLAHLADAVRRLKADGGLRQPVLDWLDDCERTSPLLTFDMERIERRMQWLSETTASLSIAPLFAVKSCPSPEILRAAHKYLKGFDVSNEVEYASLPEELDGRLVSVTSPALTADPDRLSARGNATVIVLDSLWQLDRYIRQRATIPYLLRIQGSDLLRHREPPDPAFYEHARFGLTLREVLEVFSQLRIRRNPPAGFHVHHGSEINRTSTYRAIIDALGALSSDISFEPRCVNLGGGWHSIQDGELGTVLEHARLVFPEPCAILLEPGRWYAEEAGFALGTIVNEVRAGDKVNYVVNLSKRCHLNWSQPRLVYPLAAGLRRMREVRFFGPSCDEYDLIGTFLLPYRDDFFAESGLTPGQRVVFSNVSTYSAAWNVSFNGIPAADVHWWRSTPT